MNSDRYNRWLREDIPRLIITAIVVAVVVAGLWAAQQRWALFSSLAPSLTQPTPSTGETEVETAPVEKSDNDQTLEAE